MERGQYEASHFMEEINSMIRDMVENYECVSGADVLLPPKGAVVGNCPACGAEVLDKPKGYFCSNKECRFALWKSNRYFDSIGKKLTTSIAEKLLVNGKVRLKGCKSARTGKTYDATLVMNTDEKGKAQFSLEFEKGGKR
jgi:DNA topoisomerase-3